MAVTVKRVTVWRKETENQLGALAATLEPLATAGADLKFVVGYATPELGNRAVIEVHPIAGRKASAVAQQAGLAAGGTATLLVEGDDRPGLGHHLSKVLAEAGINLRVVVAQAVGRKFSALFGFENDADCAKAASLIRKAAAPARPGRRRARK